MKRLTFFIMLAASIFAYAESGVEILEKMDKSRDYPMHTATASMRVEYKGRETANMEYEFLYRKNSETGDNEQLMTFVKPSRLKGTAILAKGDNIWYYNNRSKRVRLLTKSAKKGSVMGTSFSYEDLDMDYVEDYNAEVLDEDSGYYILKLVPIEDKAYEYMVSKVSKENYVEEWVEYYDENGVLYKKMFLEDIRDMGGFWMEYKIEMVDLLKQKKTIVEIYDESLNFEVKLCDEDFSERRLKK